MTMVHELTIKTIVVQHISHYSTGISSNENEEKNDCQRRKNNKKQKQKQENEKTALDLER